MKTLKKLSAGYTLVELMATTAITGILTVGLLLYSSGSLRMIIRNFTVNHSHDVARAAVERMLSDLHGSASNFRLVNFDGTNYSDASPTVTSDQDAYSLQYVSTRSNGVKYLRFSGGPYKIVGDSSGASPVSSGATTLKVEFGVGGALPYIPTVGDKMQIPLLSREFDITAVPTPPTAGNTQGTITLASATGFTLYTSGTTPVGVVNPVVTAYFYEHVGYTVWNNQLRYHPNYPPVAAGDTVVVRNNVTSPKPFGLLFTGSNATLTDNLNLRVSLEAYDLNYSVRNLLNGTTTVQATIPSRTQPTTLTTN